MLRIIKIGGNIVDNSAKLQAFLTDFAALDGDKILVHGGGKVATAISASLGIETVMIDGRRVTDARTLEIITMVYSGINKQIVSALQHRGCDAVGLCGADGKFIISKKRAPKPIDYGFVGDPVGVNTSMAELIMGHGLTLVVAPITLDDEVGTSTPAEGGSLTQIGEHGASGLLNTNADTVAQAIAVAMAAHTKNKNEAGESHENENERAAKNCVELIYCFEKQGVMADVNDDNSVISHIDRAKFIEMEERKTVHSGMLPKLENAFRAIDKGVDRVVICAAENIARPDYGGTTIAG